MSADEREAIINRAQTCLLINTALRGDELRMVATRVCVALGLIEAMLDD